MTHILERLVEKYSDLAVCVKDIERAILVLQETYARGGKVLVCGNGGSAADAEHIVGELMKGYLSRRALPDAFAKSLLAEYPEEGDYLAAHLQGALPTLSLVSQTALITAFSNDVAADMVFAQQVYGYGRRGDVLIGISTSGTAKNVRHALQVARILGLETIGFTGKRGGAIAALCDVTVRVPWDTTADIQERQLAIYHAVCAKLEEEFFPIRI